MAAETGTRERSVAPFNGSRGVDPLSEYGMEQIVGLIESLPKHNLGLAVEVLKKTLASLHVGLDAIIWDADRKHEECKARVESLESEIRRHEAEVSHRKQLLKEVRGDQKRIVWVKQLLTSTPGSIEVAKKQPQSGSNKRRLKAILSWPVRISVWMLGLVIGLGGVAQRRISGSKKRQAPTPPPPAPPLPAPVRRPLAPVRLSAKPAA